MTLKKLDSISRRHQMPLWKALPYELFIRAYQRPIFRKTVKCFFRENKPVNVSFVLGCYNSGTTVVKDAIALHPSIAIAPVEGDLLTDALDGYEKEASPRCMYVDAVHIINERKHKKLNAEQIISDWAPWIRPDKVFLEKSISNTIRINKLRLAFNGAKFVCVTRNVDGVVRGINRRSHPSGILSQILGGDKYPDKLLIRQWLMFYSLVLSDYDDKKADIYFVSYEKFLSSPLDEVEKIYAFMGLSPIELTYMDDFLAVRNKSLHIRSSDQNKNLKCICTKGDLLNEINEVKLKL